MVHYSDICTFLVSLVRISSPVLLPLIGEDLVYVCYAAVIWPSVPLMAKEESIGEAFGAIVSVQNLRLAVFPI